MSKFKPDLTPEEIGVLRRASGGCTLGTVQNESSAIYKGLGDERIFWFVGV